MGLFGGRSGASDVAPQKAEKEVSSHLLKGERVRAAFRMACDLYVFTNWRLLLVDGSAQKSKLAEFVTIPYRAITSFSIETSGKFDVDSRLRLWVSGRPEPVERTLRKGANIHGIQYAISASIAA